MVWTNSIVVRGEDGLILVDPGIDGSELNELADDLEAYLGEPRWYQNEREDDPSLLGVVAVKYLIRFSCVFEMSARDQTQGSQVVGPPSTTAKPGVAAVLGVSFFAR